MKGARILIFGLMLSGLLLVSCDGSGGGPTDTSNYHPSVLFAETWESYPVGDVPGGGWRITESVPYFEREVDIPSDHKLLLHGPDSDHGFGYGGVTYPFKRGTFNPTYVRYKVHPYPDYHEIDLENTHMGHFRLSGYQFNSSHSVEAITVNFFHDPSGMGSILANSARFPAGTNKISVDKSFSIELRNIQWDSPPHQQTFDLWINGNEIETCIKFSRPAESLSTLSLYNGKYGRVHYDDIFMADLPVEYNCPVVSEDPPTFPLPPMPSPTYTREPIIFIINTPAFCRGGPRMDYPKLTTYTENTQLIISGQNLEGTWWWSEESGCWISDVVGELQGSQARLEIIIPPPPPKEEPSDGSPGKPAGCHAGLGENACKASGGTWDPPGQPDTCVCP